MDLYKIYVCNIEETESSVGDFNVDILATDADTGKKIIIEN